jgi:hypothetical protein
MVQVLIGQILPSSGVYKKTLEGQRQRFKQQMDELLTAAGWKKVRANVYSPPVNGQETLD